ncbi:hypothetical protein PISL3812_04075 [Talaromyces islandicus]|uniref:Uncharacterized protein n=1 Tax=Talaromyces islandicus TaxID=28573 RepID=A0A0U1LWW5_TALIS|nr:hypothetical protein PISL3812_04075 [Talaromyces islandicus]
MGLFASKQTAPPPVPTDRVIPFRFADDFVYTRGLCLDIALRFDDVLDPEKLRQSLDVLLNKDGWHNKLEYHVPAEFSAQRPAYLFTTDKQDMSIGDHPVLSKLPRGQSDKPVLFGSPKEFRPHMRAPGAPEYLPDWLYSDIPQLAVHVLTFHDATIVTVTFMHTLTDAMGFTAFIRGWTAVLRGDEDKVPEFLGFDMSDDPIETLHEGVSSSQYLFADKLVTGWGFFLFVVNFIFQFIRWPKDELRTICVPGEYVAKLRESAVAELADEAQQTHNEAIANPSSSPPFLSEGDVLFSWWARVMLRALDPSPQQTICLMNVFDTRGVLCEMGRVRSPDIAMMANATYPLYSLIPAGKFLSKTVPLSWIASQVRYAIDALRTPMQVQAQAAGLRDSAREAGRPPLYGDSGMMLVTCSNWHRGKLFSMDFSTAIVGDPTTSSDEIKGYQRGKPSFVNATSTESGFSIRNSQVVLGKDAAGNWWIHSCLRVGAWKKVREQLEAL